MVIKGLPSVNRAIMNMDDSGRANTYNLFIEGDNLREED